MAYPTVSTLTGLVKYSDGTTLLDGYVLLMVTYPTGFSSTSISNQLVPQVIGDHVKVRIQRGQYDDSSKIIQNHFLQPIGTNYVAFFYDNNDVVLASTGPFVISSSPYTLAAPPFAVPVATTTIPTP